MDWIGIAAIAETVGMLLALGVSYGVLQSRNVANAQAAARAGEAAEGAAKRVDYAIELINNFKITVAQDYASRETIEGLENKMISRLAEMGTVLRDSINLLRVDVNRLSDRLDARPRSRTPQAQQEG